MEGIEGNMDVYPSKTERKNEEPLFFPPLVFSFVSLFLLHCAFSPFSPVVNVARNELDSPSARPSRLFFFLISGEVLISDFRFALPFFTTLYTHTCIFVWMRVCALDYPPPFDIHTQHIYIYIFSHFPLALTPPSTSLPGTLLFLFLIFGEKKKIIT